jgi:protein-tyrosine phosphatase
MPKDAQVGKIRHIGIRRDGYLSTEIPNEPKIGLTQLIGKRPKIGVVGGRTPANHPNFRLFLDELRKSYKIKRTCILNNRRLNLAVNERICFVCLGNIVRSPLAKNLFLRLAQESGKADGYEVDSAGTSGWHIGEPPDERMLRTAARHGWKYDGRARQFKIQDFERFDLIIVMDKANLFDLNRLGPSEYEMKKIHLMREFDPDGTPNLAVPDPYDAGMDSFEEVYRIIERSCRGWLQHLDVAQKNDHPAQKLERDQENPNGA